MRKLLFLSLLLLGNTGFAKSFYHNFQDGNLTTFEEISSSEAILMKNQIIEENSSFQKALNHPESSGDCIVVCFEHRGYNFGYPVTKKGVSEYDANIIAEDHEYVTGHRDHAVWCNQAL